MRGTDSVLTRPRLVGAEFGDAPWHYTSEGAFEGILQSGVLWATSSHGLNDPFEIDYGVSEVLRGWEALRPRLRPAAPADDVDDWLQAVAERTRAREFYVFSASGRGDSLANWHAYAGTDGLAIELDPGREFRLACGDEPCTYFTPDAVLPTFWRPVEYGSTDYGGGPEQGDPIFKLIDHLLDSFAALAEGRAIDLPLFGTRLERAFLNLVCHYKHPAYEHEDEFRLAVLTPPDSSFRRERVGRYGSQGYVHLAAANDDDLDRHCVSGRAQLPITRIRTGPAAPDGLAEHVRRLLDDAGLSEAAVETSSLPYR